MMSAVLPAFKQIAQTIPLFKAILLAQSILWASELSDCMAGISDHDRLFSRKAEVVESEMPQAASAALMPQQQHGHWQGRNRALAPGKSTHNSTASPPHSTDAMPNPLHKPMSDADIEHYTYCTHIWCIDIHAKLIAA